MNWYKKAQKKVPTVIVTSYRNQILKALVDGKEQTYEGVIESDAKKVRDLLDKNTSWTRGRALQILNSYFYANKAQEQRRRDKEEEALHLKQLYDEGHLQ